jgi:hypothetical protein
VDRDTIEMMEAGFDDVKTEGVLLDGLLIVAVGFQIRLGVEAEFVESEMAEILALAPKEGLCGVGQGRGD